MTGEFLNKVFQGDCVQVMRTLPPDIADMCICSPPYDSLRTYKGFSWCFEDTAKELFRVVKPGGVVVWIVADATINGSETLTSFKQAIYFREIGFDVYDTMIFQKANPIPLNKRRYNSEFEYMFVFSKGRPRTFNGIREACKGAGTIRSRRRPEYSLLDPDNMARKPESGGEIIRADKLIGNVWKCGIGSSRGLKHPAVFPLALAKKHIQTWTNPGEVVLDCMAGSGTSLLAAKQLGRNYIGVEISGEYCEIIRARLTDAAPALLAA